MVGRDMGYVLPGCRVGFDHGRKHVREPDRLGSESLDVQALQ